MELALKRKAGLGERLHQLFTAKGNNIFYEKEHTIGATFDSVMHDILTESEFGGADCLTIIDRYFTRIKCAEAERVVDEFLSWKNSVGISKVNVYTQMQDNCFESILKHRGRGSVNIEKMPKIHDRYWIFASGGKYNIVLVGASFNGFVNRSSSVFYVAKVREEHQEKLLTALAEAGVKLEEKEEAHVNPDR